MNGLHLRLKKRRLFSSMTLITLSIIALLAAAARTASD